MLRYTKIRGAAAPKDTLKQYQNGRVSMVEKKQKREKKKNTPIRNFSCANVGIISISRHCCRLW